MKMKESLIDNFLKKEVLGGFEPPYAVLQTGA